MTYDPKEVGNRYILIKEGFESKDYVASVMAKSTAQAMLKLLIRGEKLKGNILLQEVAVGEKEL